MTTRHVILTRFNCRFAARWTDRALDPAWLGPRFDLFERYCLPSVLSQTRPPDRWVIFFDAETPAPFRQRAETLAERTGDLARPHFVITLTGRAIRDAIVAAAGDSGRVLSTRLDNDDAIARDFGQRLRAADAAAVAGAGAGHEARHWLNFPRGLIARGGRVWSHRDPHNAFVTLATPTSSAQDPWVVPHPRIGEIAPVVQADGDGGEAPAWLQVVHGGNVSNKVRGRRVAADAVARHFAVRHDFADPGGDAAARLADRLLLGPLRDARDAAAALARRLKHAAT